MFNIIVFERALLARVRCLGSGQLILEYRMVVGRKSWQPEIGIILPEWLRTENLLKSPKCSWSIQQVPSTKSPAHTVL